MVQQFTTERHQSTHFSGTTPSFHSGARAILAWPLPEPLKLPPSSRNPFRRFGPELLTKLALPLYRRVDPLPPFLLGFLDLGNLSRRQMAGNGERIDDRTRCRRRGGYFGLLSETVPVRDCRVSRARQCTGAALLIRQMDA